MRNRITKTLLAAATIAAVALPAGAQAKQGADDPAGHVRQAAHQTRHHHRHHHANRGVRRHGADDNGVRRGGADDGPNHR
jgi:Spy/CpxP family protein refolding chaperone